MSPFMIPVVAILATFAYFAVQAIAQACCQARQRQIDAELKIALAQRGMSAAEIERVVAASPSKPSPSKPSPSKPSDELPLGAAPQTPYSPLPPHKEAAAPRGV